MGGNRSEAKLRSETQARRGFRSRVRAVLFLCMFLTGCGAIAVDPSAGATADPGAARTGTRHGVRCWPVIRLFTSCTEPLADAASVSGLGTVCPESRHDPLCEALRRTAAADQAVAIKAVEEARSLAAAYVAARGQSSGAADASWDSAVRFFIRERTLALSVWNVVTARGHDAPNLPQYPAGADATLSTHFPAYDPTSFPMAHLPVPPLPSAGCDPRGEVLLLFPGVVRVGARNEFAPHIDALHEALPCLKVVRVETNSFIHPSINAEVARDTIAREAVPSARLHFLGYSQGGLNALWTLATYPDIAQRTWSFVGIDVPAHGSEVADLLYAALREADQVHKLCDFGPSICLDRVLPSPIQLGRHIAENFGLGGEELDEWLGTEGGADSNFLDFVQHRLAGLHSLTTDAADAFWRQHGRDLPHQTLYESVRSVISKPGLNLPDSNAVFYRFLEGVDPRHPYNDMQVRLESQHLGGPLEDDEILNPVREGNHWQWVLTAQEVPEVVMPKAMTDRIPRREYFIAYYQALHEIGLL